MRILNPHNFLYSFTIKNNNNTWYLFISALVWGSSAKHKPQRVGKVYHNFGCIFPFRVYIKRFLTFFQEHELEDEDVVQIIKKV